MSFVSAQYGLFLIVICAVSFLFRGRQLHWLLVTASLFFYASGRSADLLILAAVVLISYSGSLLLDKKRTIGLLWLLIVAVFAPLVWFKVSHSVWVPAGISFFTLQAVAYIVDIYRGQAEAELSLPRYALFLSFFPLVLSGPIERASHLLPQLAKPARAELSRGAFLILKGVVIKCVFADNFALFVNSIYGQIAAATPSNVIVACYLYSLQIYCDFYGYTLIALGSAALLGIDVINNFEHPYLATNIQAFWSRWHISLTNWLRDYIYFSLGGLRRPINRYRNLLLTWLAAGLWHGASLTFVLWGAIHGVALAIYHFFRASRSRKAPRSGWLSMVTPALGWLVTFHVVMLAWIPFRAESWSQARTVLEKVGQGFASISTFSPSDVALVFLLRLAAILIVIEVVDRFVGMERLFMKSPALAQAAWLAVWSCSMYLAPITNVKFVYVNF